MKETDCGFLSAVEACSWDLCLWRAWKLWYLAAAALTFPAQLSLCQWGAAAVKAERPWCLQDMKSALWTVTIVWGGQTLFTAVLWQFMLSFCLFHTAVVNLDNSVVDLKTFQDLYKNVSNRRFSVWECDTHSSCQCPPLASLPPCPLRKFDMGALNLHKSGFVKMYTF